jgi:hypothetical protein
VSYVASFRGFYPSPREDGNPWTQVRIEETTIGGSAWAVIDIIDLVPLDADPQHPMVRNFTTESAQYPEGDYRISFLDADGDMEVLDPVRREADNGIYQGRLATLGELKAFLDITGSDKDLLLARYLRSAEGICERFARRRFSPWGEDDADVTWSTTTYGKRSVRVPDLRTVTSMTLADSVLTEDDYDLGWRRDPTHPTWLLTFDYNGAPARMWGKVPRIGAGYEKNDLVIVGKFGFAECPDDVQLAVLASAARMWRRRDAAFADTVISAQTGDASIYREAMPPESRAVLKTYRPPNMAVVG